MTKRIFPWIFLCLVFQLILHGSAAADSKDLNIAMVLWRGETKAEAGFKDTLDALGYSVAYTVYNADQKRPVLASKLRHEFSPGIKHFDYAYSFGTTASQMARGIVNNRIPHIFNIVTDPKASGVVESLESTGGNVSGVSHRISLDLQIKLALQIKRFKKIGFFFNPRENNSEIIGERLGELGKEYGFEVIGFRSAPNTELLKIHLQKLVDTPSMVDAVYLPLDSYIVSNAAIIGETLKRANIMSIGAQKEYIDNGALIGIVPDYYRLGVVAAKILDRHRRGEKLENIPVHTVEKPILIINETTRKFLDISIPEILLKKAMCIE